jgi:hypothetical protein
MKPETLLQIQIVEYLSLIASKNDFIFFSIPNEGAMTGAGGKMPFALMTTLKKMGMLPGIPDLCIIKNGHPLFVEIKTKTGKLQENQKLVHANLILKNCTVAVIRSLGDLENILWCLWGIK